MYWRFKNYSQLNINEKNEEIENNMYKVVNGRPQVVHPPGEGAQRNFARDLE